MEDIRQERPNEGPNFDLNKKLYRQSLNKKFGTYVQQFMVFKSFKKQCIIPRKKVINGKPLGVRNFVFPKS